MYQDEVITINLEPQGLPTNGAYRVLGHLGIQPIRSSAKHCLASKIVMEGETQPADWEVRAA